MNFTSVNPATGEVVWRGATADSDAIHAAVADARRAFPTWSRRSLAEREAHLRAFTHTLEKRQGELIEAICLEVGKPRWEAATEVQSMISKVDFAIRGYVQRTTAFSHGTAMTRFRPHGVCAVFGPFNFPGHLPNGHIIPALLAGNTVVFKPSEYTPLVAERTLAIWREAGLPEGVVNLVQGARETGQMLATHSGLDGLFFTGSGRTGQWLAEQFVRTPEKILALELGGNNPLVAWDAADTHAAALIIAQSAFLTAGQRCTCARRLIVPDSAQGDALLRDVVAVTRRLRVGSFTTTPEPFCGPVISAQAATQILAAQSALQAAGARPMVTATCLQPGTGLLSPGLLDVTGLPQPPADEEIFGPLLQVIRVPDFDAALATANATRFGLAAGLISDDATLYARFHDEVRAGIINWNQPLTGASGAAPFGGVGHSGNHRPSGLFAADYCAYPVASIEQPILKAPSPLLPGLA